MRNEEDTLLPTAYLVQLLTSVTPMPGIKCATNHIPKPPIQEQFLECMEQDRIPIIIRAISKINSFRITQAPDCLSRTQGYIIIVIYSWSPL